MKRVLIFSGTTEGRKLAEGLAESGVPAVVCVATEYGKQVMDELPGIALHQGRMDGEEIRAFMEQEPFLAAVDATHPFAAEVSENIRKSAALLGVPYLRLQRNTKPDLGAGANRLCFSTNEQCRDALLQTEGNILLTTGSKELAVYTRGGELTERLYVRVLPSEESIALCRQQGLAGKQIIAMQGPFSEEMNMALIRQYQIRHLVTKETGHTGGFVEKASAAEKLGTALYVIGNPEKQDGLSFAEVWETLESMTGTKLREAKTLHISLVGLGMGSMDTLTEGAKEKLKEADCLFGAKRLLTCMDQWKIGKKGQKRYPYYLAEDILPLLDEMRDEGQTEAAILFSGDSGFYSGSQKLYQKLKQWKQEQSQEISLRIYPGISSVSYFAAACGVSWHDAKIISIHGKGQRREWESEVLAAVRYEKKVFLLVSGVRDVQAVGTVLKENGIAGCQVMVGYQLSYPEEKVVECTLDQCEQMKEEGLYILAVFRRECEKRYLAPQKKDAEFIRGKVPMTKEEIRELAVCKLKLTEEAVVYDIGSGTGSVAAEIAERSEHIQVYGVERNEEAAELISRNQKKFRLPNVVVIKGRAPECLAALPRPTHAFIGGSGGRLKEILEMLYQKNPTMRIVITAVSLETAGEILEMLNRVPTENEELIQVQVSRGRKAGAYHLMQAENPIYICSFDFMKRE